MRVAMITEVETSSASGVRSASHGLARALSNLGLEVTIIGAGSVDDNAATELPGIDIRRVQAKGRAQLLSGFREWTRAVHAVLGTVRPQVVLGQGLLHNGVAAATWTACPSVVTAHGNPLEDARYAYGPAMRVLTTPFISRTVSQVVRDADVVVNVSEDWRANLASEPRRHAFIANPIEEMFFAPVNAQPRMRVRYFGGSRRIKGGDLLAETWPHVVGSLPDAQLMVYGIEAAHAGPFTGLAGVSFAPTLDAVSMAAVLTDGGLVVVPSRYEVSPLVIAEAWASGAPVVATAVGGVPVMAKGAAWLCTPDVRALSEAITAALRETARTAEYVQEGRCRAEGFRPGLVAQQYIRLFEELTT